MDERDFQAIEMVLRRCYGRAVLDRALPYKVVYLVPILGMADARRAATAQLRTLGMDGYVVPNPTDDTEHLFIVRAIPGRVRALDLLEQESA